MKENQARLDTHASTRMCELAHTCDEEHGDAEKVTKKGQSGKSKLNNVTYKDDMRKAV